MEEEDHGGHDHGHDHGHGHDDHDHGELDFDPHTWNDPLAMAASANLLADHLSQAFPEQASNITARNDALQGRLTALHESFVTGLGNCTHDLVITNHEAHAYLAKRYGFELLTLHGLAPGSEPSPATIQEVIDTIREHNIPTIFIEEGADADALRAIQHETRVAVDVLHTLESRPASGDYMTLQQQNLQALRTALACS
ncbi:MAG: metal ABC transporter solute-binding protein, Zn/Mn family [Thermoplasmatota archaeon]